MNGVGVDESCMFLQFEIPFPFSFCPPVPPPSCCQDGLWLDNQPHGWPGGITCIWPAQPQAGRDLLSYCRSSVYMQGSSQLVDEFDSESQALSRNKLETVWEKLVPASKATSALREWTCLFMCAILSVPGTSSSLHQRASVLHGRDHLPPCREAT